MKLTDHMRALINMGATNDEVVAETGCTKRYVSVLRNRIVCPDKFRERMRRDLDLRVAKYHSDPAFRERLIRYHQEYRQKATRSGMSAGSSS